MKPITGREIALSGITASLAVIAVVLSFFVPPLSLSFFALAAVALTLPMMADSVRGSILAYVASAGLSFAFIPWISAMPYVLMFGPYPILDYYLRKYLKRRVFILPIEILYANLSFVACYFAMGLTPNEFAFLNSLPVWARFVLIFVGLTAVFVIFHFAFNSLYDSLSKRLSKVLKKR